ncbi:MAG: tail fiber domain-containing protein [Acidobacteria bacterium]|nr:tail fiber domain-containing protein [Acidobacteriota bacterium]MBI3423231.1 tail fiber domain-containing protein [Acidobacteriota bacterium]
MRNAASILFTFAIIVAWVTCYTRSAQAQTTAFTYQGKLTDAGQPANGNFDLQFKLFDTATVGTGVQQGGTLTNATVTVSNGVFTVTLDFGANVFSGAARWLEISVRPAGSVNAYTVLTPRQPINSTPYAIQTLHAASADVLTSACVACVQGAQIAGLPTGSTNYIQNSTAQQASSNFNISGNGLINGNLGIGTATPNDKLTVQTPTSSFGITHTDGIASVGTYIGAGSSGYGGWFGTKSNHPLFFYTNGGSAQMALTTAGNLGIGTSNPLSKFTISGAGGTFNTAGLPRFDLFNTGCNCGMSQFVTTSGYWGLATSAGQGWMAVGPTGDVQIGGTAAYNNTRVTVSSPTNSYGVLQSDGNIAVGTYAGGLGGWYGTQSNHPLFFFTNNGNAQMTLSTAGNVGINAITPLARLHVNGGTSWFQGDSTPLTAAAGRGVAVGMNNAGGYVFAYDYALGAPVQLNMNLPGGSINLNGFVTLNSIDTSFGGGVPLCWNLSLNNRIASCSSSSIRYKTNLAAFPSGMALVRQLRPVTFDWKANGQHDVGFVAEEVAEVNPLFVTYNQDGQVEGVKYDRLGTAFVNAFKEQQAQIESQTQHLHTLQNQLKQQQQQLDTLRKLVCQTNPQATACQE